MTVARITPKEQRGSMIRLNVERRRSVRADQRRSRSKGAQNTHYNMKMNKNITVQMW